MKIPVRFLVLTPVFTALTIVGAFIKIPFPAAPLTLQVLFVLMSGYILGPVYGPISQLLYLAAGLSGIPVFAYGGGLTYIFNPTFGFLIGFVLMSYVSGRISIKKRSFGTYFLAGLAGLAACYALGLPYLFFILNIYLGHENTILETIYGSMLIFLPGDILKIITGSYLSLKITKRMDISAA